MVSQQAKFTKRFVIRFPELCLLIVKIVDVTIFDSNIKRIIMKASSNTFQLPIGLPPLSTLRSDHPGRINNILQAIHFFDRHTEWTIRNQEISRHYFHIISSEKLSEEAERIFSKLRTTILPSLFPNITLVYNRREVQIPADLLKSTALHKLANLKPTRRIEFSEEEMNILLFNTFALFLTGERIVINEENAMDLLRLAECYEIPTLSFQCAKFIKTTLDQESIASILFEAVRYHSQNLKWACLIFLTEHPEQDLPQKLPWELKAELMVKILTFVNRSPEEFPQPDLGGKFLEIWNLGARASKLGIKLSFSDPALPSVELPPNQELNEEVIQCLHELNQICPIKSLCSLGIEEKMLHRLDFLNLSNLIIPYSKVTSIPQKMLDNLLHIQCNGCRNLKSLIVPNATVVNCHDCFALTTLKANHAKEIDCSDCPVLIELEAISVISIKCVNCIALIRLFVGSAENIDCSGCSALTSFWADNPKIIDCSRTSLRVLEAANAESIKCSHCPELIILVAINAKSIDCSACPRLPSLEALEATSVNCSECTVLTNLVALKATSVILSGCPALIIVVALKATTIECPNFINLKSVVAPKAKSADCSGCTALINLVVTLALSISCDYCPELTSLTAPFAKKISCFGCPELKDFHTNTDCKILRDP